MYPGYWGPHFAGWMWVMPVIFLIVFVVLMVVLMSRRREASTDQDALRILERRYARGEITTEQYVEIKRTLEERPHTARSSHSR